MDEMIERYVQTINEAGGSMAYAEFLDTVPYPERSRLPDALRLAKERGQIRKQVAWNAESGETSFTVRTDGE